MSPGRRSRSRYRSDPATAPAPAGAPATGTAWQPAPAGVPPPASSTLRSRSTSRPTRSARARRMDPGRRAVAPKPGARRARPRSRDGPASWRTPPARASSPIGLDASSTAGMNAAVRAPSPRTPGPRTRRERGHARCPSVRVRAGVGDCRAGMLLRLWATCSAGVSVTDLILLRQVPSPLIHGWRWVPGDSRRHRRRTLLPAAPMSA
jgi:hypothetical protein